MTLHCNIHTQILFNFRQFYAANYQGEDKPKTGIIFCSRLLKKSCFIAIANPNSRNTVILLVLFAFLDQIMSDLFKQCPENKLEAFLLHFYFCSGAVSLGRNSVCFRKFEVQYFSGIQSDCNLKFMDFRVKLTLSNALAEGKDKNSSKQHFSHKQVKP